MARKQSIECVHITEFHLNFHSFIFLNISYRPVVIMENCLLIHRRNALDIIIGKVCEEINKL